MKSKQEELREKLKKFKEQKLKEKGTSKTTDSTAKTSRNPLLELNKTLDKPLVTKATSTPTKTSPSAKVTLTSKQSLSRLAPSDIQKPVQRKVQTNVQTNPPKQIKFKISPLSPRSIILNTPTGTERIQFIPINLLSLQSAISAAKKNQIDLARLIFKLLSKQDTLCLEPSGSSYKIAPLYKHSFHFYKTWLQWEEKWENYINLSDIYYDATDNLSKVEDLSKLKEQYHLSLLKFKFHTARECIGLSDADFDVEEGASALIQRVDEIAASGEEEAITHEEDPEINRILGTDYKHVEEDEKYTSIASMFSAMNISKPEPQPVKVKQEFVEPLMNTPKKPNAKKVVGVPINPFQDGSNITVLTPVRAKGKLKDLGVDKVITPVRRSLRFHDSVEYVGAEGSDTKSKVVNLLKEHEFAYAPNEGIEFKLPRMVSKEKKDH